MSGPPTLERSLAALSASHRRVVAETIGSAGAKASDIAGLLRDEARLEGLVGRLPGRARAAVTELAFAAVDLWRGGSSEGPDRATLELLERHGLAYCFRGPWTLSYIAPADLVPALRRIRIRAHARRLVEAPEPLAVLGPSEQLLHDAAALGATVAQGGIQIKADGDLYAKARPKLAAALGPIADGSPDFGAHRIDLGLALLQELGALRVGSDDLPGRNTRRVLEIDRDPAALLDLPFAERVGLARVLQRVFKDLQLIDPLLDELAGRTIGIEDLGAGVEALFIEAGKHPEDGAAGTSLLAGLAAVRFRLLCGGAAIGVDAGGNISTVTLAPAPPPAPDGPPCVAQGDFELVAMRPLLPHERAGLLLLCEPVAGREHTMRLTRERIHGAVKALRERDPAAVVVRLRALAGTLPQNVERAVTDWVGETRPRARLRSAIVVDVGDGELGTKVAEQLGPLVVERLAPHLLAVAADELTKVANALRRAGVELDPGLDRISGPWEEPRSVGEQTGLWWRPSPEPDGQLEPPHGRLVSGIESKTSSGPVSPTVDDGVLARLGALGSLVEFYDDDEIDDEDPIEVLIDAYETDERVELTYAAAEGTVVLQGTVDAIEGVRFKLAGPGTGPPRWRWLKGLQSVRLLDD